MRPAPGSEKAGGRFAPPRLRPKDAATLIVLRRDEDAIRVLMGRRADTHAFMPGAIVFPGGRVDRTDRFAPASDELHPAVEAKLLTGMQSPHPGRARALALAAIRETYEETGVLIASPAAPRRSAPAPAWAAFVDRGLLPTLAPLRLVARAITPPGQIRRFDARFFAVFSDAIAAQVEVPDVELKSPAWLTFAEARDSAIPKVTRLVLDALDERLATETALRPGSSVPFYQTRYGQHQRREL